MVKYLPWVSKESLNFGIFNIIEMLRCDDSSSQTKCISRYKLSTNNWGLAVECYSLNMKCSPHLHTLVLNPLSSSWWCYVERFCSLRSWDPRREIMPLGQILWIYYSYPFPVCSLIPGLPWFESFCLKHLQPSWTKLYCCLPGHDGLKTLWNYEQK